VEVLPDDVSGYMEDVRGQAPTAGGAASALRRAAEIAGRVVRGLRSLAVVAAACVFSAWLVWLADSPARGTEEWVERIVALAVLVSPSAVLLVFLSGLRELARLPERAGALPGDARAQFLPPPGPDARGARGPLASLVRLARLAWGSRDVLSPYAAVTIALRPAILLAALAATAAALLEVPAALLAIVIMSVT
jgi:hypothetical protein